MSKWIKLIYAVIPLTNYLIDDNNNFIVIDDTKILISNGTYNADELISEL